MRAQQNAFVTILAVGLFFGLLAVAVGPVAFAIDEVPVPPGSVQVSFGIAGLAHLQTARLNVVAIGGGQPDPADRCLANLSFRDATGQLFRDASGMPIATEVALEPGKAARLDLREADAFRGRTGLRVAFQANVELRETTSLPPNPCTAVVPTLEIYNSLIGRTALFYPEDVAAIGGGQPDPSGIPFGIVGLGRLQTGRLNVVAIGGGQPDPSELPICPVDVGFVNDAGEPFRDASGMPIAAQFVLSSGKARALDLKASDAFRGSTGMRKAFRAVAQVTLPPNPCQPPVATLEVFDNLTGRSSLIYAPKGPAL
jgi:hypothetical protein